MKVIDVPVELRLLESYSTHHDVDDGSPDSVNVVWHELLYVITWVSPAGKEPDSGKAVNGHVLWVIGDLTSNVYAPALP